jgi:shikimate kinase
LNGVTVWLDVPVEDLAKRVTEVGTESRPLLGGKCAKLELSRLMQERWSHYAKAHCRLSLKGIVCPFPFASYAVFHSWFWRS